MVTKLTIINLDIHLKGIAARADRTHSLTVQFNFSISSTCSFFDAKFRNIPRSAIYNFRGSNSLSACICVILKPRFRYSLWTCLIPSQMFFIFRFLIILPVANIMCQDMVFRKKIPLMCMRSQHRGIFLYLSRMPLGKFGIMIGSTCWILWRSILPCKCGTLGSYLSFK